MSIRQQPSATSSGRSPHNAIEQRVFTIGVLLLAFTLRVQNLGAGSLWYDETVSAYLATQSLPELVAHTARDIHPPAYYILLHLWRGISQPSPAFGLEFLYAWPSLWLSIIVVAVGYAIARKHFGKRAAMWAIVLATIQPTQYWFAQEVRMYALGALCVMLTLWAVSPLLMPTTDISSTRPHRILYVLAALLGIYSLYYFLFWLAVLNLVVTVRIWHSRRLLRQWIILQAIIFVGWLPWLPTFLRQALSPPVPGWREGWANAQEVVHALAEAIAGTWFAHSIPVVNVWLGAIIVFSVTLAFYGYANQSITRRAMWVGLSFGPTLILFAISLFGTPIYHVRYVATYAAVFPILVAALLVRSTRIIGITTFVLLLTASAQSILQLTTYPPYQADDHRTAVATLASNWRPGDTIIANAGWVYTAIELYWPTELASAADSRPPALNNVPRLTPNAVDNQNHIGATPMLWRTGSVDGDPFLGWNLPESDFFAISRADTFNALEMLSQKTSRIWHYRLYDTVSDPTGSIRAWFDANTVKRYEQAISGRDFLRLETYQTANAPSPNLNTPIATLPDIGLQIMAVDLPGDLSAGEYLYLTLTTQSDMALPADEVALSLRLLTSDDKLIVQQDAPLLLPIAGVTRQVLALPVPADTIPSTYQVAFVIYNPTTLAPYDAQIEQAHKVATVVPVSHLSITLPDQVPHVGTPLATFDYIELVSVTFPNSLAPAASTFPIELTWRPQPSSYRDHYRGQVDLVAADGSSLQLDSFDLGAPHYLSSVWPAAYPLRQRAQLHLPPKVAAGTYTLRLSVIRASDAAAIPARQPWLWGSSPAVDLGSIQVASE